MRLALILLAGCINPLIPPARVTKPENEKARAEAKLLRERADALGDAHPIARRYFLGLAALRAGGVLPAVDLTQVSPEIAVKLTGVACPLLEKNLGVAQPGNPALHVDVEVSVEGCGIDDHTDSRTQTTAWTETVVDRIEETPQTRQVCSSHYESEGDQVVGYGHDNGDAVKYVKHTTAGMRTECHDETWVDRRPITHQAQRTGTTTIYNHIVKLEIDAVWFARRDGRTEDASLKAHASNASEQSWDRSPDDVIRDDASRGANAIRRGIAKLLAKEIAAEEALAKAAANDDDRDEHDARAIALGSRDNPLAKRFAADGDLPLRIEHGTELTDPEQPDKYTVETRYAADLDGTSAARLDVQYEEVGSAHGELVGASFFRNLATKRTTERGGHFVDAIVGSAAIGYANGLAWDLALGYGAGAGWRDGRGSGFSIGMRALSRVTRLGDSQVYYTALPAYARLELALPHGSIALDATGFSVSGRDLWRGSVLITTQSNMSYRPGHYVALTAERARVHGRDGDTDLGAPQLSTFWLQLGSSY